MTSGAAATALLYGACGGIYLLLTVLLLVQLARGVRISSTGALLAAGAGISAAWATAAAWQHASPLEGAAGALDLVRALVWYGFVLHLFGRSLPAGGSAPWTVFRSIGALATLGVAAAVLSGQSGAAGIVTLASPGVALRLALAVCQLLLLENLYRNTEHELRWSINLACVALGGLAAFDLALCADAALFHRASTALVDARAVAALLVCPLLALAAARNRAWSIEIHVSRSIAFHSATLVVSGVFLLAVAAVGMLARQFGGDMLAGWSGVAQISTAFAGLLVLAVLLTSGTVRSLLRSQLVDHFFSNRYDYRHEWLRCIDTLSDEQAQGGLYGRVVRAVAQVVDSPAGILMLRDAGALGLHWADSWNLPPPGGPLPPGHALLAALEGGAGAFDMTRLPAADQPAPGLWLAVPLRHHEELAGCVLVAHPRAPFKLDREVFDLLRIVAHEVATYIAEQRATRVLLEARELRAYGERFAFVAHDIKNVSSQLSLLLSNAETHLANPEFQRDMLLTVGASVQKIGALIQRLQAPDAPPPASDALPAPASLPAPAPALPPGRMSPATQLTRLAARVRQLRGAPVVLEHDASATEILADMDPAVFDTVVTHLLDNAIEAAGTERPVRLRVGREGARVLVDIIDSGPGMTPAFVRDQLFRPFRTSKRQGSGIGAYQARALLRAASGDLMVLSRPGGGTTMRLLLPLAAEPAPSRRPAVLPA